MKKVLFVLAVLTMFALAACDSNTAGEAVRPAKDIGSGNVGKWVSCNDSDGGQNLTVKAQVVAQQAGGQGLSEWDSCVDSANVKEWYCQGKTPKSTTAKCNTLGAEYVCEHGACVVVNASETMIEMTPAEFSIGGFTMNVHITDSAGVAQTDVPGRWNIAFNVWDGSNWRQLADNSGARAQNPPMISGDQYDGVYELDVIKAIDASLGDIICNRGFYVGWMSMDGSTQFGMAGDIVTDSEINAKGNTYAFTNCDEPEENAPPVVEYVNEYRSAADMLRISGKVTDADNDPLTVNLTLLLMGTGEVLETDITVSSYHTFSWNNVDIGDYVGLAEVTALAYDGVLFSEEYTEEFDIFPYMTCNDTDGGQYPNVFGNVSGYVYAWPYNIPDGCLNTTHMREEYCIGDTALNMTMVCDAGTNCSDGYCH